MIKLKHLNFLNKFSRKYYLIDAIVCNLFTVLERNFKLFSEKFSITNSF